LRIKTVIYSDLVDLSHLTVQLETPSGLGANDQALSPAGYEPNHDKLRYDQKRQVSTPSRKKCGHLRRKESLESSQEFKASLEDVDKTRPVIDATRQDSIDKTTTVGIDTVE